jgi:hypothetical protein
MDDAGITSDPLFDADPNELVRELLHLGKVPLVHAHEWNLTPDGPLDPSAPAG